jgi:hypothetical protein
VSQGFVELTERSGDVGWRRLSIGLVFEALPQRDQEPGLLVACGRDADEWPSR